MFALSDTEESALLAGRLDLYRVRLPGSDSVKPGAELRGRVSRWQIVEVKVIPNPLGAGWWWYRCACSV